MTKFVTRPRKIEAIQWTGENDHDVIAFAQGNVSVEQDATALPGDYKRKFIVLTVAWSGRHVTGYVGDYVVRDETQTISSPQFNLINKEQFEATYTASDTASFQWDDGSIY